MEAVVDQLFIAMELFGRVHTFAQGMGITAPPDRYRPRRGGRPARRARRSSDRPAQPRIIEGSSETEEQYEGCLSFFDVRGLVRRPLTIVVETTTLDGATVTTVYGRGLARLIHHEIDHLDGILCLAPHTRRPGTDSRPL